MNESNIVPAERVRTILARAAELDAKGIAGINQFELQKIAEEAGISAAAFAQAMREENASVRSTPLAEPLKEDAPKPTVWARIKTSIPYVAVGGIFGLWGGAMRDDELFAMSIVAMIAIAAYRVFAHRRDRDTIAFQFEVIALFTGLFFGAGSTGVLSNPEVVTGIPVLAVITALIGTALLATVSRFIETSDKANAVPTNS